ncbi:unnamed protein product [Arabidopsis halleri]
MTIPTMKTPSNTTHKLGSARTLDTPEFTVHKPNACII